MATSFPTSLDALTNPTGSNTLASPDHAGQHADANDAIEALQAKVGVDSSAVVTSLDYKVAQKNFLKPISGSTYPALGNVGSEATAGAVTVNTTYYTPFFVPETPTYNQISIRAGSTFSGTGTVRLGIYSETQGKPATLVLDAGTVSVTVAGTVYTATISQSLTAGMYFLAANSQTAATTNTFYTSSGSSGTSGLILFGAPVALNATITAGFTQSSVTGAFANAGTLTAANPVFRMSMRAA